eukprot:CAMPEP_0198423338 /NCGR_PEP_ID=MMETSP1452-20131203/3034_1 /TAXON_ID=1181717 /ORGANISM="Synchroma pusillum, Strain CCMP3072" /LENGTH=429 /DNA_ID=CAMNT_0044143637 /DNA_START=48 /DNA_END=1333 /DNA_ORIENTATION=+
MSPRSPTGSRLPRAPDPPGARRPRSLQLLHGQLLSAAIAGTGITSSLLSRAGVDAPTFQSSLIYALLTLFLARRCARGLAGNPRRYVSVPDDPAAVPCALDAGDDTSACSVASPADFAAPPPRWGAPGDLGGAPKALSAPWYHYAALALVDLEANFLFVKAYQYTSITSIMLLDGFTIPCAMVLSRLVLSARYTPRHGAGVLLCLCGLGCTVLSDVLLSGGEARAYPHAVFGDALCLCGAVLYATSNVGQEYLMKRHGDREEFLGMLGAFGAAFAALQASLLERAEVGALAEAGWGAWGLLAGFTASMGVIYVFTAAFLRDSDAALFNLSLLTSDLFAVLFAFLAYGDLVGPLYFVALALIAGGLYVYHTETAPTAAEPPALSPGPPGRVATSVQDKPPGGAEDEEAKHAADGARAALEHHAGLRPPDP